MATPTETIVRVPGFGARRFLVRGQDFASEEQLGIIRPTITDYPERFTLNPLFPFPGRRGGSRPRPEEIERSSVPTNPTYPQPRPREPDPLGPGGVSGALPPGAEPSPFVQCLPPDAGSMSAAVNVGAGVTTVLASQVISRPFIIRHIEFITSVAGFTTLLMRVKIARDNSTAGGAATTGTDIEEFFGVASFLHATGFPANSFPNFTWRDVPVFIKLVYQNTSGAAVDFSTLLELDFLS